MGGSLGVQVKMCRDKIPQLMIVAEDSTLLINGGCCMWAITSAKISMSPAKMRIPLSEYFSLMTFRWSSVSL